MKVDVGLPLGVPDPGLFEIAPFNATCSEGFADWLATERVAIVVTMGNAVAFVGCDPKGVLRVDSVPFKSASAIGTDGSQTIFLVNGWQLTRFENCLGDGETDGEGHDRLFLPQLAATIGTVGAYDLAVPASGQPLFTNALCNCVATPSRRLNFTAVWKPPFVSALVGEDRCHLTGLALDGDELAYVSCAAETDRSGGWRDRLDGTGVIVDVRADSVLARGLTLPHSPRLHEGRLYVTGGDGSLSVVDRRSGEATPIAVVPGIARGLAFSGGYAVVGCSRVLDDGPYATVSAAAIPKGEQRHSVSIVDLAAGRIEHELALDGASGEVFGLCLVRDARYAQISVSADRSSEQVSIGPARRLST